MYYMYEYTDALNSPYEAFYINTSQSYFPIRPHFHHYFEVIYMQEGNIFANVEGKEYYMSEGDILFIFNDQIHSFYASSSNDAIVVGIKFNLSRLEITSSTTPKLYDLLLIAKEKNANVRFNIQNNKESMWPSLFAICKEELSAKQIGFDIVVHAHLCLFVTELIRKWSEEGVDFTTPSGYKHKDDINIRNILEYIDEHLDENLKVEELAKRCNMSYSNFAKCFKEMYGRSCKEHLELLRVEKSDQLLISTDMSLSDIAVELGYSDLSHFIRIYKKYKGTTPGKKRTMSE